MYASCVSPVRRMWMQLYREIQICRGFIHLMASPVYASETGIKFRPEEMKPERLYHCIFKGKAMLVFKDSQDVLNCYEIEDLDLVEKISKCSDDGELEALFDDYLAETRLNC